MKKSSYLPSCADQIISECKVKEVFFTQINHLVDWQAIARLIENEGLVLFKMELLRTWYGLSNPEVEEQVKDRLSLYALCRLVLGENRMI